MVNNSVTIIFTGFFRVDAKRVQSRAFKELYEPKNNFTKYKEYFLGKYQSRWLTSIFSNPSCLGLAGPNEENTSLFMLKPTAVPENKGVYDFTLASGSKTTEYWITSAEVFLLDESIGMFNVNVSLAAKTSMKGICSFVKEHRRVGALSENPNPSRRDFYDFLYKKVVTPFSDGDAKWYKANQNLKVVILVDCKEQLAPEELDRRLFSLASMSVLNKQSELHRPSKEYYNRIIENNSLSIFNNWKALILSDSLCRISFNLEEVDKYRLWENEYIYIYNHLLFMNFYLYSVSSSLDVLNSTNLIKVKEGYNRFLRRFTYVTISYKFLPNEIYEKVKAVLRIDEIVGSIDEKVNRLNQSLQEKTDRRLNRLLFALAVLTMLSISLDGGDMVRNLIDSGKKFIYHPSFLIFTFSSVVLLYLFKKK